MIRVIRGDATLLTGQTCTRSCITSPRTGAVQCTVTACTPLQFRSPESFPIPSRGSPETVDNLFLSSGPLGPTTFHFNPYVIGVHRLSSAISIGHPQAGWSILSDGALQ
jgi:hypothetical protein